ncbi:hypothetical protein ABPG74_020738 [Tetrahymena malaccensis]
MKISILALLVLVILSVFIPVALAEEEEQKTVKVYNKIDRKVKCLVTDEGCDCWVCNKTELLKCKYICHDD